MLIIDPVFKAKKVNIKIIANKIFNTVRLMDCISADFRFAGIELGFRTGKNRKPLQRSVVLDLGTSVRETQIETNIYEK